MRNSTAVFVTTFMFVIAPSGLAHPHPKEGEHRQLVFSVIDILGEDINPLFVWGAFASEHMRANNGKIHTIRPERLKASDVTKKVLSKCSIQRGVEYHDRHNMVLDDIAHKHNVDPATVMAILRIESDFGDELKNHDIVLVTLYRRYFEVHEWKRKKSRLEHLALFVKIGYENDWDILEKRGSRVGAFGLPQFMPFKSSLFYAVDGDGDGRIDLYEHIDAMHSIANYLHSHRWSRSTTSKRNALRAYNNSTWYVNLVLEYRKRLTVALTANN